MSKQIQTNIVICLIPGGRPVITRNNSDDYEEVEEEGEGEEEVEEEFECAPIKSVTAELKEQRKILEQLSHEIAGLRQQVEQRQS